MATADTLSHLVLGPLPKRIVKENRIPLDLIPVYGSNVVGITEVLKGLKTLRARNRAEGLEIPVDPLTGSGLDVAVLPPLREHQVEAVRSFMKDGALLSGTLDAPPGFGKTFTSLHIAKNQSGAVLILVPTTIARDQWCKTLRTRGVNVFVLGEDRVFRWGEYGAILATYWLVTTKQSALSDDLASVLSRVLTVSYGTLILDEVHKVPAPIFSTVCGMVFRQTTIGCTATLIRSDGRIKDLDELIGGPVRFSVDYETLTGQGLFPEVEDKVLSVPMHTSFGARMEDGEFNKQLLTTLNPNKLSLASMIVRKHQQKSIVFCDWVRALAPTASFLRATQPLPVLGPLSGASKSHERESTLSAFRNLPIGGVLVISRIGEMALDVPDAAICIQISHTRSAEAAVQRRGRITRKSDGKRPKSFILVSQGTPEAQNTEGVAEAGDVEEVEGPARTALLEACRNTDEKPERPVKKRKRPKLLGR